jgi:hypothetical protein
MPDYEEFFKAFEEQEQCAPQIRIYLMSDQRPPTATLFAALADYEVVLPRSKNEIALIRKMSIEWEEQFRMECERVAAIMAPLLVPDSYLGCMYDDAGGTTRFQMELRKPDESPNFIETDPASNLG